MSEAETNSREIIYDLVSNIVKSKEKKKTCYICLEDIHLNDRILKFCCNKIYHEYCLSQYAHVNQYPKCPICRKFIRREVIDALQIIYREYEVQDARAKMHGTDLSEFTQDENPHNQSGVTLESPPSREHQTFPFNLNYEPLNQPLLRHLRRRPAMSLSERQALMLQEELDQRRREQHSMVLDHLNSAERSLGEMSDFVNQILERHFDNFLN